MATYYSSSANRRDAIQNLYARDPSQVPYPDPSLAGNTMYLNYSSSGPYSDALTGSTQSHLNCMVSQDSSAGGADLVSSQVGEHGYNVWRDGRSEMLFMQTVGGSGSGADDLVRGSVSDDPQMGLRSHLGILNGQNLSLQQSNVSTIQGQGLSLSLSTQMPLPSFQYRLGSSDISFLGPHQSTSGNGGSCRDDNSRSKHMNSISSPYGQSSITTSVPNSKYLKAAHQLLDEVVNVRKALKNKADKSQSGHTSAGTTGCQENDGGSKAEGNSSIPQESTANSSSELSPSERQDLQNKVTKLLAMLDEVDQRYKQYYHQMQIVVSSFDAIAGCGASKPYTALALQTISRHFRCLRDAITGQIRATRKSLGEQDRTACKGVGISRLRYIDQHLRQQRAMQQFGMMQPHAWRPQRGLPETSVSILRAWLFEHFLHPYPKDSEKLMLARQTGLTRSQVSNWFINARVRLWKPMIEEMYKEEGGEALDSNSSSENAPKGMEETRPSVDREDMQSPTAERCHTSHFNDSSKSNLIHDIGMGSATASGFHNEGNVEDAYMNLKLREQRSNGEDCSLLQDALAHADGSGRFMAYQMAELGRYGNSGVSLTLGLQHCDDGLPGSNNQQSFMAVRAEEMYGAAPALGANATDYEYMNMGDRQHRFSSSHLLHDFVA